MSGNLLLQVALIPVFLSLYSSCLPDLNLIYQFGSSPPALFKLGSLNPTLWLETFPSFLCWTLSFKANCLLITKHPSHNEVQKFPIISQTLSPWSFPILPICNPPHSNGKSIPCPIIITESNPSACICCVHGPSTCSRDQAHGRKPRHGDFASWTSWISQMFLLQCKPIRLLKSDREWGKLPYLKWMFCLVLVTFLSLPILCLCLKNNRFTGIRASTWQIQMVWKCFVSHFSLLIS